MPTTRDDGPSRIDDGVRVRARLAGDVVLVGRLVGRCQRAVLVEHGLTAGQWAVLRSLDQRDGLPSARVAEACALVPSRVTALGDELEDAGYLTRERPTTNRRTVILRLTGDGRAVLSAVGGPYADVLASALADVALTDLVRAQHVLDTIRTNVSS